MNAMECWLLPNTYFPLTHSMPDSSVSTVTAVNTHDNNKKQHNLKPYYESGHRPAMCMRFAAHTYQYCAARVHRSGVLCVIHFVFFFFGEAQEKMENAKMKEWEKMMENGRRKYWRQRQAHIDGRSIGRLEMSGVLGARNATLHKTHTRTHGKCW